MFLARGIGSHLLPRVEGNVGAWCSQGRCPDTPVQAISFATLALRLVPSPWQSTLGRKNRVPLNTARRPLTVSLCLQLTVVPSLSFTLIVALMVLSETNPLHSTYNNRVSHL